MAPPTTTTVADVESSDHAFISGRQPAAMHPLRAGVKAPRRLDLRSREQLEYLDNMDKTLASCNFKLSVSTGTLGQVEKEYNRLCHALSRISSRATPVVSRKTSVRHSLDLLKIRIEALHVTNGTQDVEPVQYDTGTSAPLSGSPSVWTY